MRACKLGAVAVLAGLAACGGGHDKEALRTVKGYEVGSCDSAETTDATELEAIARFNSEVRDSYFVRDHGLLTVANHERDAGGSGLRQYRGPFYTYVHLQRVSEAERALGVDWNGMVFLHAESVRQRRNGEDWSDWQRVRTRNFADQTRSTGGLTRWQCLMYAEIAWADVQHGHDGWHVTTDAASVYDQTELERLLPLPTAGQLAGNPVEAGKP